MNLLAGERLDRMGASFTAVVDQVSAGLRVGTGRVGGPGGRRLPCIESTRTLPGFRPSSRNECRWVAIVVDDVNTGMDGLQAALFVQGLRLPEWESVEFLSNIDSGGYALGDRGALLVWTRGSGPHRSEARDGGG